MDQTKKEIGKIAILLFVIVYIFVVLPIQYMREDALNKNGIQTKAVVTEFYSITQSHYYRYKFTYKGIEWEGGGPRNPNRNEVSIGDSLLIRFDTLNPKNNEPLALLSRDVVINAPPIRDSIQSLLKAK